MIISSTSEDRSSLAVPLSDSCMGRPHSMCPVRFAHGSLGFRYYRFQRQLSRFSLGPSQTFPKLRPHLLICARSNYPQTFRLLKFVQRVARNLRSPLRLPDVALLINRLFLV